MRISGNYSTNKRYSRRIWTWRWQQACLD